MASAVLHSTPASLRPHSSLQQPSQQSTVYEHGCLFTHDIRRKNTKRWQDGYLKFHSFNKRVMVYDQSRNYIGDTHCQTTSEEGLEDGEELMLDRSGVLVQVGERLATEATDLSELLAKRAPKPVDSVPDDRRNTTSNPPPHLQPLSLNATPRTPGRWSGWAGRAQLPKQSPFEAKQAEIPHGPGETQERSSAKKRRLDEDEHVPLWQVLKLSRPASRKGPLQSAATIPSAKATTSKTQKTAAAERASAKRTSAALQATLKVKEIIDITSSVDDSPSAQQREVEQDRSAKKPVSVIPKAKSVRQERHTIGDKTSVGHPHGQISAGKMSRDGTSCLNERQSHVQEDQNSKFGQVVDTADGDSDVEIDEDRSIIAQQSYQDEMDLLDGRVSENAFDGTNSRYSRGSRTAKTATAANPVPSRPPSPHINTSSCVAVEDITLDDIQVEAPTANNTTAKAAKHQTKPLRLAGSVPKKVLHCKNLTSNLKTKSRTQNVSRDYEEDWQTRKKKQHQLRSLRTRDCIPDVREHDLKAFAPDEADKQHNATMNLNNETNEAFELDDRRSAQTLTENYVGNRDIRVSAAVSRASGPPDAETKQIKPSLTYGTSNLDLQFLVPYADRQDTVHPTSPQANHNINAINATTTAPRQRRSGGVHRPFRRHYSETSALGSTSNTDTNARASETTHAPLKRADTSPARATTAVTKSRTALSSRQAAQASHSAAMPRQREEPQMDRDAGPWSTEAWDLFGWCPDAKAEALGWARYECAAPAAAVGVELAIS